MTNDICHKCPATPEHPQFAIHFWKSVQHPTFRGWLFLIKNKGRSTPQNEGLLYTFGNLSDTMFHGVPLNIRITESVLRMPSPGARAAAASFPHFVRMRGLNTLSPVSRKPVTGFFHLRVREVHGIIPRASPTPPSVQGHKAAAPRGTGGNRCTCSLVFPRTPMHTYGGTRGLCHNLHARRRGGV